MRLLDTEKLSLETVTGLSDNTPLYAILSHTWGDEEVLYEDVLRDDWTRTCRKAGVDKILRSAALAKSEGWSYIWIDTCCIDKSSSAELSEAINSMFNWYHYAAVCYAYLSDARAGDLDSVRKSRWFKRGWTLQELIAPVEVCLFDSQWQLIGEKSGMVEFLWDVTSISEMVLNFTLCKCGERRSFVQRNDINYQLRRPIYFCRSCDSGESLRSILDSFSAAARMSWAASRETTRIEDEAYSLLGLFGINMPLLYGEGAAAFRRLQEVIIGSTNATSLLTFHEIITPDNEPGGALALSPSQFRDRQMVQLDDPGRNIELSPHFISLDIEVIPMPKSDVFWLGILKCRMNDYITRPAIAMRRRRLEGEMIFELMSPRILWLVTSSSERESHYNIFGESQCITICATDNKIRTLKFSLILDPESRRRTRDCDMPVHLQLSIPADCNHFIRQCFPPIPGMFKLKPMQLQMGTVMMHLLKMRRLLVEISDGSTDSFFLAWELPEPPVPEISVAVMPWNQFLVPYGYHPLRKDVSDTWPGSSSPPDFARWCKETPDERRPISGSGFGKPIMVGNVRVMVMEKFAQLLGSSVYELHIIIEKDVPSAA